MAKQSRGPLSNLASHGPEQLGSVQFIATRPTSVSPPAPLQRLPLLASPTLRPRISPVKLARLCLGFRPHGTALLYTLTRRPLAARSCTCSLVSTIVWVAALDDDLWPNDRGEESVFRVSCPDREVDSLPLVTAAY